MQTECYSCVKAGGSGCHWWELRERHAHHQPYRIAACTACLLLGLSLGLAAAVDTTMLHPAGADGGQSATDMSELLLYIRLTEVEPGIKPGLSCRASTRYRSSRHMVGK